jgi:hypothetical protein
LHQLDLNCHFLGGGGEIGLLGGGGGAGLLGGFTSLLGPEGIPGLLLGQLGCGCFCFDILLLFWV